MKFELKVCITAETAQGTAEEQRLQWQRMASRSPHIGGCLLSNTPFAVEPKRRVIVTDAAPEALAAVERGERVMMLNPFTLGASERNALSVAANCLPAIKSRNVPSALRVKEAVDSSKLGELGLLRMHRWQPLRGPETLRSLLAAELDLAIWLYGKAPPQSHAMRGPGSIQVHLGFQTLTKAEEQRAASPTLDLPPPLPTGGMALLSVDTQSAQQSVYHTLSAIGSLGAIHVDDHHNLQLLMQEDGTRGFRSDEWHLAIPAWLEAMSLLDGPSALWQDVTDACQRAASVLPEDDVTPETSSWTPALLCEEEIPGAEVCAAGRPKLRAMVLSVVKHDYIAHAVAAHPRFEMVGVADEQTQPPWVHERNQLLANQFQTPYQPFGEEGLASAIAAFQPDVAIISSQAERHCQLAIQAAAAGLHVIVDKPLSTKLGECRRLCAAIDEAGVACLMWNRNFLPAVLQARQLVASGRLGSLRAVHCDFYFAKDAGPPKGVRRPGYPPISWLARQVEAHVDGSDGGVGEAPIGELQVEAIYPLAYLRLISGCPVQSVYARATSHFHQAHADNHVDDLSTVSLELEHGVVGSISIGRIGAASHPDLGEIKLHLQGSQGTAVLNESRPEVSLFYRGQPAEEFRHQRVADENNMLLLESFIAAVEHDRPTVLDAQAGAEICAVVEACLRSCYSGNAEKVEPV